ncbi:MAG TPA: DUF1559 domain-containing protein, partial [Pirellulales bacterium]
MVFVPLGIGFLLFLVIALTGGLQDLGHTASRDNSLCRNNLKQIALALHNYASVQGSFPPAYTVEADGRKMHSWRALLLPYFEAGSLERDISYDYKQPWDSSHNRQFADKMPSVYRCPRNRKDKENMTSYFAIVGKETFWPHDEGRKPVDIHDGLSNTIAVVEVTGTDIPWLEPRDLAFDELTLRLNDTDVKGPSSKHGGTVHALLADG